MSSLICHVCGGNYEYRDGKGYVCKHCGNLFRAENETDEYDLKLNYANLKRINEYDFKGALRLYREVLESVPNHQEANFGALLAFFQVIYVANDKGEYVANFLDPETEISIPESEFYERLDPDYRTRADSIEDRRKLIAQEFPKVPDYDVFVCYRRHLERSETETEEADWAKEVYEALSRQKDGGKLRVFYDKQSLAANNAAWEPHIYAALRSAKFMVVLGSSKKNIESTWVKNEWKRFLIYKSTEDAARDICVVTGVAAESLPDELTLGQIIRPDDEKWLETVKKRAIQACTPNEEIELLLTEANELIIKKLFAKAKKTYETVLERSKRNARACWGLLKCRLKAQDDYDLVMGKKKLTDYAEYQQAIAYAVGEERERYRAVANAQISRETQGYDRPNFRKWRRRQIPKIAVAAATFALVLSFGIYAYVGVGNSVSYTVENGEATASGKNMFFSVAVKDLQLGTYGEYPVVKIGEGAFANTAVQTVTLGESVKVVGSGAFRNCSSLTSVTLEGCTYLGDGAFEGCGSLREIRLALPDDATIGENAFSGVPEGATVYLPSVSEEAAARISAAYPALTVQTYTLDAVEECLYFIEKLNTVSMESEARIRRAEEAYAALDGAQKAQIANYGVLQNARAAFNAVQAIGGIGTVTLESESAIAEAEKTYAALTDEQKTAVSNYETLVTARAVYRVMALIQEIGTADAKSESKVIRAEEAYAALTYEQRDLVSNYEALTAARNRVNELRSAAVAEYISAIGKVSLSSKYAIELAEGEYATLNEAQKNMVPNYDVLQNARAVYDTMKAIEEIGTITARSESAIERAKTLFDGLTSVQRAAVTNYLELEDADAVFPVVKEIDELSEKNENFRAAIAEAEAHFAKLTAARQEKVSNLALLVNARAAQDTVERIEAIGTPLTEADGAKIEAARASYNGLTAEQRDAVSNYRHLADSEKAYPAVLKIAAIGQLISPDGKREISEAEEGYKNLTLSQRELVSNYEKLSEALTVLAVAEAIEQIGQIGPNSGVKIATANNLYRGLSEEQKARVANAGELTDAVAVFSVVEKIDHIRLVTLETITSIEEIELAYGQLTAAQRLKVSNYESLIDIRAAYSTASLINDIGTITENSKLIIETAQSSYNRLTTAQKNRVGNYNKLLEATKIYNIMIEINGIGEVSLLSGDLLSSIEVKFNALNASEKSQVSNYDALSIARAIYNLMLLVEGQNEFFLGKGSDYNFQTLSSSNMVVVLNNATIREEVDSVTVTGLTEITSQERWIKVFRNLRMVRFDLTAGLSKSTFCFAPSNLIYRLVGAQNTYNLALTASSGDFLHLEFDNFSFLSQGIALDLSKVSKSNVTFMGSCQITSAHGYTAVAAKDLTFTLHSLANVVISAGNGVENKAGGSGISATKLELLGSGSASTTALRINGGDGGKGAKGNNGCTGGIGVDANTVFVSATHRISINGGKGGEAGACVTSYSVTDYGKEKRNGSNGFNGGKGGDALSAFSLTVNSSATLECAGGVGGAGSAGGNGGGSDDSGNAQAGHGGAGGNGGQGGSAVYLSGDCIVSSSSANIKLMSGSGGAGGNGGAGGAGKNDHRRDNGGNGGIGGVGGDSGYCIFAKNGYALSILSLIAGDGGSGGIGGRGGSAYRDSCVTVTIGNGGSGGKGGDCVIVSGLQNKSFTVIYGKGGAGGKGGNAGGGGSGVGALNKGTSGTGGIGGNIILNGTIIATGSNGNIGKKEVGAAGGAGGAGATISS